MRRTNAQKHRSISAYNELLHAAREIIEASPVRLSLAEWLHKARDTVAGVKDFSQLEFEKTRYYIERDLQDMVQHARQSERDLADWLRIDLSLVEGGLLDLFASVADPTRVQLDEMIAAGFHSEDYLTDEVTGPGRLECVACGELLTFYRPSVIPACAKCNGQVFRRSGAGTNIDS
ncbi:MAG: zinc ribbon-containing protein [Gammaproteobacteria bacterium]|nr:zinc ribbon-containing protein [Gammaproteobacteria bacterium]